MAGWRRRRPTRSERSSRLVVVALLWWWDDGWLRTLGWGRAVSASGNRVVRAGAVRWNLSRLGPRGWGSNLSTLTLQAVRLVVFESWEERDSMDRAVSPAPGATVLPPSDASPWVLRHQRPSQ